MRSWILVPIVALLPAGAARAQNAADEAAVISVVDGYHDALARGDSTTALAMLMSDAIIVESGGIETREEYRSGHIRGDMRFAESASRSRGDAHVKIVGDMAWVASVSNIVRESGGETTTAQSAELMVLVRDGSRWAISAVHWSSRRRPAQ